jgi:hypothetical protein
MLTLYTTKGDAMHVRPLPFGLALTLLRRPEVPELRRPKPSWSAEPSASRDCLRTDARFAAIRQRFVS